MQALTSDMVVLGVGYAHVSGRKVNVYFQQRNLNAKCPRDLASLGYIFFLSLSLKRGLAQLILLFKDDLVVVEDFDIINLLAPMPVLEANFGVDCAIIIECAEGGSVLGIHLELVPYLVATHGLEGVAIPILAVMIERRRVFGKHLERVDHRSVSANLRTYLRTYETHARCLASTWNAWTIEGTARRIAASCLSHANFSAATAT